MTLNVPTPCSYYTGLSLFQETRKYSQNLVPQKAEKPKKALHRPNELKCAGNPLLYTIDNSD